jgi:hypothetical protein
MARLTPSPIIDRLSGAINKVQKDGQDTTGVDLEWRQLDNGDIVQATKGGKISESDNDRLPQQEAWCKCDVEYRQLSDSEKDDLRDRARRIDWDASIYQLFMSDCINERLSPPEIQPDTLAIRPSTEEVFNPNLAYIESPAANVGAPLSESEVGSHQIQPLIPLNEYADSEVRAAAGWEVIDGSWDRDGYFLSQYPADQAPSLDPPTYDASEPKDTIRSTSWALTIDLSDPNPSAIPNFVKSETRAAWIDDAETTAAYSTGGESSTWVVTSEAGVYGAGRGDVTQANNAGQEIYLALYRSGVEGSINPIFQSRQVWQRASFLAPLSEIRPELSESNIEETPDDFTPIIYWKPTDDVPDGHAYLYPSGEAIITGSFDPVRVNRVWDAILEDAGLR